MDTEGNEEAHRELGASTKGSLFSDGEVVHKTKRERKKAGYSACENILNSQRLNSEQKSFARQGCDRSRERRGVAAIKRERDTHLERPRICSARRRTPVGGASTAMRLRTVRLRPTRNGYVFKMVGAELQGIIWCGQGRNLNGGNGD
ncbi:hypothetical protein C8R44DRAFT_741017 [Mycena epipterygia]|nr:hypothetical protein C8R44DRAFT_741017 [Mycena epipterygia]